MLALILFAIAFAVGAAVPLQSAVNARMGVSLGHALYGALTNTAVATLIFVLLILAFRLSPPNLKAAAAGPWWLWTGGMVGGAFVFGALFVAPRIGATNFAAATVFGSMAAALLIDHFGLVGFPVRSLSLLRVGGAACVIAGVLLIQASRN